MRASEARGSLLDQLEPDLRLAGFAVTRSTPTGAGFWDEFVRAVDEILGSL